MPPGQHIRPVRRCAFWAGPGRSRYYDTPAVLRGFPVSEPEQCDCLMCLAEGDNSPHRRRQAAAKAFKAVWEEALNGKISPEQLAAAYKDLNIRDDG